MSHPHIVIAGGGVAAVEAALALHALAGPRVRLSIVTPNPDFELRALRTAEPFAADHVRRHAISDLAGRVGAELIADRVLAVDPTRHAVRLAEGGAFSYDALILAVGARHRTAFARAITFTGDGTTVAYNGLLADLEEHWSRSVAFVVPPGITWALPLYELALMTARDVRGMGIEDARLQLVTPEPAPLAVFGPAASHAVGALLDRAGVTFTPDACARSRADGHLELLDGTPLDAERVVALPTLEGPQLNGVPGDERGFIPVDEHGRVLGLTDVYAAGDGTTYPVKQGGLACQQADAIAALLAASAGADVEPEPFRPVLRGRLLAGDRAEYLSPAVPVPGARAAGPSALRLWSAARKVDGRHLSAWLEELDGGAPVVRAAGDLDVEVALPAYEVAREAMLLDPYSPVG